MRKCLPDYEAFKPEDLNMLRIFTYSAVCFVLAIGYSKADDTDAGNKPPNGRTAFEQLLPSPIFSHGMRTAELERQIETHFSDWLRTDTQRAMNNRSDIDLLSHAKDTYLQRISISIEDKESGKKNSYSFALTSPLSGGRVYSIVHVVESTDDQNSIISWSDLVKNMHSKWGIRHSGNWSDDRARFTYVFGADGRKLENAMERCGEVYPSMVRLDEKTEQQVVTVSEYLLSNDCGYSKDFIFVLDSNKISKSAFYNVDFQLQVSDVLKRVVYGIK